MRAFRVTYLALLVWLLSAAVTSGASPIRQLTNQVDSANLRPTWSPDHKRIAYQSNRDGTYHIYLMDADGSNTKQLSSGANVDDRHPAWSPDGAFVAVDSGDGSKREIWIIEVSSQRRTQVTRTGAFASFPSWSPDGKRIAYYVYREGTMDLFTVARDGSAATQLTKILASEQNNQCTFACHSARWSPDSSRLAYSDGDLTHVVIASATGGSARVISPDGERNHFPVVLDGGKIVYVSEHLLLDQSWTDLWLVDPDNSGQRTQVAQGVLAQGPFELSSDGKELLFASPRSGNFEIYAVTLDDAGKAALATRTIPVAAGDTRPAPAARNAGGLSTEAYIFIGVAIFAIGGELTLRLLRRRRAKAGR